MFERYTEKARRTIFLARYEASQFGAMAIDPEHILLGLLREDLDMIARFCPLVLPPIEDIRGMIRSRTSQRERILDSVDLPLSRQAMRVLHSAADQSEGLRNYTIGTEHLLLGLLQEGGATAGEILRELKIESSSVQDELRQRGGEKLQAAEADPVGRLSLLVGEMRNLAMAMLSRCDRVEAIIEELSRRSSTSEGGEEAANES